jgi:hypothetical protein
MRIWILVFLIIVSSVGCKTNPEKRLFRLNNQLNKAAVNVESKNTQIEDKGKSFVYGAKYSNSKETNRTPAIDVSARFLDLAQLTLGNPSIKDAAVVKEITDGLLAEADYKVKNAEEEKAKAEFKLSGLIKEVETLQNQKTNLQHQYELAVDKVRSEAEKNAAKARLYDEENSFWNQINPFHDLGKFFKKLVIWGVVLGFIFTAVRILEFVFPQFSILGAIAGGIGKLVFKIVPTATKAAGVVPKQIWDFSKKTVLSIENTLKALEYQDIESDLIKNYPETHKFEKKDVLQLLQLHSEKIEGMLKVELTQKYNEDDQAILNKAKINLGLKQQSENMVI